MISLEKIIPYILQYAAIECVKISTIPHLLHPHKALALLDTYGNSLEYITLRPFTSLTDEEAIHIARLAHQTPNKKFKVVDRYQNDSIHVEHTDDIDIVYHVCINKYGEINANVRIPKSDDKDKIESFKQNIGEIHFTDQRPLPYMAIHQYLCSIGIVTSNGHTTMNKMMNQDFIKIIDKY